MRKAEDRSSPHLSISSRFDVAVIGAGPAGAVAAERLARGGLRIALIEKEPLPRYKTCGGGLVPRALIALPPGLLLDDIIEHECPEAELRIEGRCWSLSGGAPWVSMTMRSRLDAALVDAAVRAGAELRSSCQLTGVRPGDDDVVCDTSEGPLRSRWVIAADGAAGPTARLAGWPRPRPGIAALEWELDVPQDVHARHAGIARFDFDAIPGGYAWIFPKRRHLSAGILSTRRPAPDLVARLETYLAGWDLSRHPVERHGFLIPLRPRRGGVARERVLLVGDAAGLADPITAEGISGALESGALAAEAILSSPGSHAIVRRHYRRALARRTRDLRLARGLAAVLYRPGRLRSFLFHRLGDSLTRAVGEVIAGRASYGGLLLHPRHHGRLLTRLLSPVKSRSR